MIFVNELDSASIVVVSSEQSLKGGLFSDGAPSAPQLVVLILAGREHAASVLSVGYLGPAEKRPDFAYEPCAVAISAALRGVLIFVFV